MKKMVVSLLVAFMLWSGCGMCFAGNSSNAPESKGIETTQLITQETEVLEIVATSAPLKAASSTRLSKFEKLVCAGTVLEIGGLLITLLGVVVWALTGGLG